jgi:hypothetical protein
LGFAAVVNHLSPTRLLALAPPQSAVRGDLLRCRKIMVNGKLTMMKKF